MSASGQLMAPVRVGRLETVAQWRREVGRIYRAARRGDLNPSDATKLTFIADVGAKLAKYEQELKELNALREQVARLEGRSGTGLIELLPAVDGLRGTEGGDL